MSFEFIFEILSGLSLIATAIFPTIREYFLAKSSQIEQKLKSAYLNTILQILIIMIYFNILQIIMLIYIYYMYRKSINSLYFIISVLVVLSSLISNIISLNIQISKYNLDLKLFDMNSINNVLTDEYGLVSFISRIVFVSLFLIVLTAVIIGVYVGSQKIRSITENYFKKLAFQKFYGDSDLKNQKINESFEKY